MLENQPCFTLTNDLILGQKISVSVACCAVSDFAKLIGIVRGSPRQFRHTPISFSPSLVLNQQRVQV